MLGHNAYAYCLNNSVNMADDDGTAPRDVRNQPYMDEGVFSGKTDNSGAVIVSYKEELLTGFDTLEEALYAFADSTYQKSVDYDYEYTANIYYDSRDCRYYLTISWTDGKPDKVRARELYNAPTELTLVAIIHTHGRDDGTKKYKRFSKADKEVMNLYKVDIYLVISEDKIIRSQYIW